MPTMPPTSMRPGSLGNRRQDKSAPPPPGAAERLRDETGSASYACASDEGEGTAGHEPDPALNCLWRALLRLEQSVAAQRALLGSLLTSARQPSDAARDR